jgi:hypothetical protein
LGELGDRRVRLDIEFLLEQRLVDLRVADCTCVVARGGQRAHQLQRYARVQRLQGGEALPPFDGVPKIRFRLRLRRQRFQRCGAARLEPCALVGGPPLELWRAGNVKAVEKRPVVQRGRARWLRRIERLLELADVARDHFRVQSQIGRCEKQVVLLERPARMVQRLGQCLPGFLGGALRPQQGEHPIPRHATLTTRREDRE